MPPVALLCKEPTMRHLLLTAYVHLEDRRLRRLRQDAAGLTVLAYALGAAFVVVPLTAALYFFAQDSAETTSSSLDALLDCVSGNQADAATENADPNAAFNRVTC